MKDPISICGCLIDRAEIAAVLPQAGMTIIFLKGGKTINLHEDLSREELDALAGLTKTT